MNELIIALGHLITLMRLRLDLTPRLTHRVALTAGQSSLLVENNGVDLMKVTIQNVTPSGAGQEVSISRDPITATTDGFILDRLGSRDFVLERGQRLHGTAAGAAPEVAVFEY